jgi:hypothetical protein
MGSTVTLNASTGTGYTYQWYYYRTFQYFPYSETITISGATSSSYTSSASFVGYYIYCTVTATNAGGSNSSTSGFVEITTATVAKPSTPSAPDVTYRGTRNSRTYTWDVSYTIGTDATSMDVMNQYFTSSSGTYTSSPYDTDPSGTQASTYDGYIEYRNFASAQAMPLTDANGYWDNNNSWMRARVRARNAGGASSWSGWSPWR